MKQYEEAIGFGGFVAARVEYAAPVAYRLFQRKDGVTVLQGQYKWVQGIEGGYEWRDIPTEIDQ